ncbi:MAG: mannonate dehydratase [Ignavibacteriales bacterium]|nr:mannonate dehydratase [Ignavibacteriales bacterium]
MAFEQTWRWFGPKDPYKLKEIKQTGATGIVSALHQIPVGEIWSKEDIIERKNIIESEGFNWSVVESLPVHENIKKRKNNFQKLIENYKSSLINLSQCGIDTVCYNFMPVLDWSRTDLQVINHDGSISSKFDSTAFRTFDLFILKRKDSEMDYTSVQIEESKKYYNKLSQVEIDNLISTVLYGLPGSMDAYSLNDFKYALSEYNEIGKHELRNNLYEFIKEIISTAEESNINLAIHPDDPPWSLLGLPRVVGIRNDLTNILNSVETNNNGLTFCTGSLGVNINNDVVEMAKQFSSRVNFIHLRNVVRNVSGDFKETYHLEGDIDLYSIVKEFLLEQKRRMEIGRKDYRMPMRPDHGHLLYPDFNGENIYPGYSLVGRLKGLAELRGLELGITRTLF